MNETRTLEIQRAEFKRRRLLAMPIAGALVWLLVGIAGATLASPMAKVWTLFIGVGSIAYLGMFVSKFTGENFLEKGKPKNEFDRLFFLGTGQALLVFAIAIPFFMKDHTSLPLTVGILTGLMWLPLTWIIEHWVGLMHTLSRTALIVLAWYALPQQRFVAIPLVIVAVYLVTIYVLEQRWRTETAHA